MSKEYSKEEESSKHTSVLYFHGMGEQRRYEEVSCLVDGLDIYSHSSESHGILKKIKVRLEKGRGQRENDVAYIRSIHAKKDEKGQSVMREYRFYECYWAPITAGGSPATEVLKWLARQVLTPIATLRSPWRARQRLRRAALIRMWERCNAKEHPNDIDKIFKLYDDFEGQDARRDYPEGNFKEFIDYLGQSYKDEPEISKRLIALAKRWHSSYIHHELFNLFALVTLFLSILLGGAAVAGLAMVLLKVIIPSIGEVLGLSSIPSLNKMLAPDWKNISALMALFASLFGITRFLRDYIGDVQFWSTYEETDEKHAKRREILKRSTEMLSHVLEDPNCERVVVIAHSLGTAIAHDALLDVARHNRARNADKPMEGPIPLENISHFITMGSPIDKILTCAVNSRHEIIHAASLLS